MIGKSQKAFFLIPGVVVALLCVIVPVTAQQTTRYVYDNNGRLKAVVSAAGEATIYEYDAAGDVTGIRRNSATTLEILSFAPHSGVTGDSVTFIGTGFGGGVTSVAFNGTPATVLQSSPTVIVAQVAPGTTTGLVTITTPTGSVTTSEPFTIVGVRVSPPSIGLLYGESFQFTTTVSLSGDQSLTWSVNGIAGGNSTVRTVTQSGLYTAPSQTASVTVRATSNASPSQYGEALVSVRDSANVQIPISGGVSVRHGSLTGDPAITLLPLSVRYGSAPGYGMSPPMSVSVTTGPVVTGISPGNVPRNAATSVTITGSNLAGANALKFIKSDGSVDTAITVSNLNVNVDGTQLTATLTLTSGAALGQRVVVVMTPTLHSLILTTGSNTIQVQ